MSKNGRSVYFTNMFYFTDNDAHLPVRDRMKHVTFASYDVVSGCSHAAVQFLIKNKFHMAELFFLKYDQTSFCRCLKCFDYWLKSNILSRLSE